MNLSEQMFPVVVILDNGYERTVWADVKPARNGFVGLTIPANFKGTQYDWYQAKTHNQSNTYILPAGTLYRQIMLNKSCPLVSSSKSYYNDIFIPHSCIYVKKNLLFS